MASPQAEQMKATMRATRANAAGGGPPQPPQKRGRAHPTGAAASTGPGGRGLEGGDGAGGAAVDYRLAPEHPHPAPVNDSVTVYEWLLGQGIESRHIAVSGDSAGGGLAVATLIAIRDRGLPNPAAGVPLSPWIDMEATGSSM